MASSSYRDMKPAGLNPNMIYRPLTPPTVSLQDEDPPVRVRFHFIGVLRLVVLLLDFSNIIFWLVRQIYTGPEIATQVFLWLLFVWQAFMVLPKTGAKVTCEFGPLHCTLGSLQGGNEPRKLWNATWTVDAAFAIVFLVLTPMTPSTWMRWGDSRRKMAGIVINSVLIGLESAIVVLSHFKIFRPVAIYIYSDEFDSHCIALPRDVEAVGSGTKNVSVAA